MSRQLDESTLPRDAANAPGADWRPAPGEVSELARTILRDAVTSGASDIHFNRFGDAVLVRLRVDGLLRDHRRLLLEAGRRIVHHLKALAGMNIIERRRPQDGRLLLEINGGEVDFRLATIRTLWGENLAIRIFDKSQPCRGLVDLGLDRDGFTRLFELIHSPQGLFLVTGPTGAGKTTTLYAALEQIKRPELNLLTVEDPIEREIPLVNQVGVQPERGIGFLECLRSAFRQDPDVLMIGEIRDFESARIAIRAALSGHFVLSTLHTGTSSEAIAALMHLGVEPFLIATSLVGVVAQQLVRTICSSCREEVPLEVTPAELAGDYGAELRRFVPADAAISFSYGQGCERCLGSGYRDRVGIFEILRVTTEVRKRILQKASAEEIEETALAEGMVAMRTQGIRLVVEGRTTIEEVLRVVPVQERHLMASATP